jgi:hypothetical protein
MVKFVLCLLAIPVATVSLKETACNRDRKIGFYEEGKTPFAPDSCDGLEERLESVMAVMSHGRQAELFYSVMAVMHVMSHSEMAVMSCGRVAVMSYSRMAMMSHGLRQGGLRVSQGTSRPSFR